MLTQHQVGRFEIRDFLGRGAIGDVYLAWDPQRQGEVAIKLVRLRGTDPEMLDAEKNGLLLQRQLAEVASQVACVYEQGEDGPYFWASMEYVAGTDLSDILENGPLPEERAARIAHQICSLLEVTHQFSTEVGGRPSAGVVHGDIKPENIRLQDGDLVRVLDFGIAKHLSQTRKFTVNLFGSLPYTPPERLDRGAVDYHSDLWAVGVVLYRMVAGRSPYSGTDPEELENRIRRGEAPEPLPRDVAPGLRRIVQKCLAFRVENRYPTAAAFRADLEAWLEGRPLAAEATPAETAEDLNLTRRTVRPLDDGDRTHSTVGSETRRTDLPPVPMGREVETTRRTGDPDAVPPPPPIPFSEPGDAAPVEEAAAPEPRRYRPRKRWLVVAGVLLMLFGVSQLWVRGEAREIRQILTTERDPDLDGLLARYQGIARWDPFGLGLGAAREELRDAFVRASETTMAAYRGDSPTTTERGWQRAYEYLQAAQNISYTGGTRTHLLYIRAQLDRIEAQALRARGETDPAQKRSEEAISGFRTAARRDKAFADPFLGLARIYAYDRFDLDKLRESLTELERRGYKPGRREKAMLADGYRMRGIEIQNRALREPEPDDQISSLESARDHLVKAVDQYDEIGGYANVRTNRADAERRIAAIDRRLNELGHPDVWDRFRGVLEDQILPQIEKGMRNGRVKMDTNESNDDLERERKAVEEERQAIDRERRALQQARRRQQRQQDQRQQRQGEEAEIPDVEVQDETGTEGTPPPPSSPGRAMAAC